LFYDRSRVIWSASLSVCNWPVTDLGTTVAKRPILLKNSKMHSQHFLAKLDRDREFAL